MNFGNTITFSKAFSVTFLGWWEIWRKKKTKTLNFLRYEAGASSTAAAEPCRVCVGYGTRLGNKEEHRGIQEKKGRNKRGAKSSLREIWWNWRKGTRVYSKIIGKKKKTEQGFIFFIFVDQLTKLILLTAFSNNTGYSLHLTQLIIYYRQHSLRFSNFLQLHN